MKRPDHRPLCGPGCLAYAAGEIGTRYCKNGHWDERVRGKMPLMRRRDWKVFTPWSCKGPEVKP